MSSDGTVISDGTVTSDGTVITAWQAALTAEQRARFGYGVLGPRLAADAAGLARAAQDAHEQLIADTSSAMAVARVTPADPAADYPDLYPVASAAAAVRLAVRLEQDAAAAWRFAYATAAGTGSVSTPSASDAPGDARVDSAVRTLAQRALTGSAVRATQWRIQGRLGTPVVPFPGI